MEMTLWKLAGRFEVACIQAAIADHFKMFLRDMPDQTFDEVHNRDRFLYIFIIFVSIVMKSDHKAVKKVYRFNCPNCQSRLEGESKEFEDIGGKISKFFCPVCKKDRYITWSDLRKKTVYEGENTQ